MVSKMNAISRNRPVYAILMVLVIGAGLIWRSGWIPLNDFFGKYGGDALWALVVFLGFGLVWHWSSTLRIALVAVGFAWAIEFSQLYHAPWIDGIRSTLPGRLILGYTFNPPDLIAYLVGVGTGALAEWLSWGRGKRQQGFRLSPD